MKIVTYSVTDQYSESNGKGILWMGVFIRASQTFES